jgi:hypothetical protein
MRFNRIPGLMLMASVCAVALGVINLEVAFAACPPDVAGAYLTTITSGPTVVSRSTILFNMQGTMSAVDSGQGPVGFTASQGAWDCRIQNGRRAVLATNLNFNNAGDTILRTDYQAIFDPRTKTIAGTIVLLSFPLLANPLGGGGTVIGTFTFTGRRIEG